MYLADDTDLSGGNPEFNTLNVETQASTAMAVSWEYHTDEPPETLAFEVALQQGGRRRIGRHTGHNFIIDAHVFQTAHLFADGTV